MNTLLIINGSAYGLDSTRTAVRPAAGPAKRDGLGRWTAPEEIDAACAHLADAPHHAPLP